MSSNNTGKSKRGRKPVNERALAVQLAGMISGRIPTPKPDVQYWQVEDLAAAYGLPRARITSMAKAGLIPQPHQFGRAWVWMRSELKAWAEAMPQDTLPQRRHVGAAKAVRS